MIKKLAVTVALTAMISSTMTALIPYPGNRPIWECDAPGTEGYFLTEYEIPFRYAADSCAISGGVLADITNQNFMFATEMILNCAGENHNAWIRSWDYNPTNPQVRDCLAIYVGFSGPGGGINIECTGNNYALCMIPRRRNGANENVAHYGSYNNTQIETVAKTVQPDATPTSKPFEVTYSFLTSYFTDFYSTSVAKTPLGRNGAASFVEFDSNEQEETVSLSSYAEQTVSTPTLGQAHSVSSPSLSYSLSSFASNKI